MREMGNLMYLTEVPEDQARGGEMCIFSWARRCYERLKTSVPTADAFWSYVDKEWLPKIRMWVTGFRNIPHAGQDTNAAIESYHGNMKAVLRASRGRLVGRRVDWLIHQLTGDVINRYEYQDFRKEHGFISNKKERALALSAIVQARKIPDDRVRLPVCEGHPALVQSVSRPHLVYAVHNPSTQMAVCECIHSQKGSICKHQVKVLRMMRPDLAEGRIARTLGTLHGTARGGIDRLLAEEPLVEPPAVDLDDPAPQDVPRPELGERYQDEEDLVHQLILKVLERAYRYPVIWKHWLADLKAADARHSAMEVNIDSGLLHPSQREARAFAPNVDGRNNSLRRFRDFLDDRGYRVRPSQDL